MWILVIALALEAGQIGYSAAARKFADSYRTSRVGELIMADEATIAATAAQAPQPPPEVKRELPPRDTFLSLDEEQRADFAVQRRELTLLCDPAGKILALYASPEPREVAALARRARVGESIASLFPPEEGRDALSAVQAAAAFPLARQGVHEYSLRLEGFPQEYACGLVVLGLKDGAGTASRVLASVFDSKYEIKFKKYRGNIYRDNRLDPWVTQFNTASFWTNSRGFRDREVAVPKPPGVCRIVCIGGSTTLEGPRNDLTYPKLLEKRLREHFQTDRIEVLNCGVEAANSMFAMERMEDYLALEPDLIIDYDFVNEAMMLSGDATKAAVSRGATLRALLCKSRFLYMHFSSWLLPSLDETVPVIRNYTQAHQRAILEAARKRGATLALCSIAYPDFPNLPLREVLYFDNRYWWQTDMPIYARMTDAYNSVTRDLCRGEGLLYLPVQEELKGGMDYFADIAHMRLPGIQSKADIIFRHVKDYVAKKLAG